jgi:hypothetical protein
MKFFGWLPPIAAHSIWAVEIGWFGRARRISPRLIARST